MIVKPETLIGWHRKGFKAFWKWKSRVGRPRLPESLRKLIVRMALENYSVDKVLRKLLCETGRALRKIQSRHKEDIV